LSLSLSQTRSTHCGAAFLGEERRCNSMSGELVLELSFNFLTLISFIGLDCGARRVLVERSIVQGQKF
jgi:hypothetical protein